MQYKVIISCRFKEIDEKIHFWQFLEQKNTCLLTLKTCMSLPLILKQAENNLLCRIQK